MQNFFHQSLTDRRPPSSLHWQNFGADNGKERVYTRWSLGCYVQPRGVVRFFPLLLDHLLRFHTIPKCGVPFVTGTYFWSKRVRSFLFRLFSFLSPFYAVTCRTIFNDAAFDLPSTFFLFCNTCLFVTFRTSFGVPGPNIILLYNGMASKSIRYNVNSY